MKKWLKIALISILCIIILLVILFFAKFFINKAILNKINKNVEVYTSMKSYAVKYDEVVTVDDEKTTTSSSYCQNNDLAVRRLLTTSKNGETKKLYQFFNNDKCDIFIESGNDKIYLKDTFDVPAKQNLEGVKEFLINDNYNLLSLQGIITTATVNGEKCYKITVINNLTDKLVVYYSKETGLKMKQVSYNKIDENIQKSVGTYQYAFEEIPDYAFDKPDISEYKLIEQD